MNSFDTVYRPAAEWYTHEISEIDWRYCADQQNMEGKLGLAWMPVAASSKAYHITIKPH